MGHVSAFRCICFVALHAVHGMCILWRLPQSDFILAVMSASLLHASSCQEMTSGSYCRNCLNKEKHPW